MKRSDLEKAFTPIPEDCYHVLLSAAHSVQEEKSMKRKVSAALVFAMVLILVAGVALAVVLSMRDTGRQVIEIEQTQGYYADWPLEQKTSLVSALVDLGYTESTDEIQQLLSGALQGDEANRVADEAMAAFTGLSISEISFMGIMEAAWGPFDQWTTDEQAWYTQLMADMNLLGEDHTQYVMPQGPIDEAGAIAIAKHEVAQAFGADDSALDGYMVTTSFQVPEFAQAGDTQAYWYVEFNAPDTMPSGERLFLGAMWAFVHPETGEVDHSMDELVTAALDYAQMADAIQLQNEVAMDFDANCGSVWDTYAFKQRWEPQLSSIQEAASQHREDSEYSLEFMGAIEQILRSIGLPKDSDISNQTALESAKQAVKSALSLTQEITDFLMVKVEVYTIPQDGSEPYYQFIFCPQKINVGDSDDAAKALNARWDSYSDFFGGFNDSPRSIAIRINAQTGEASEEVQVNYYREAPDYWSLLVR